MTDKEKAIVMAYTGVVMLKGSANECNLYNEKREEIIEMLKMLKKAARYNDYNTLIEDVRLSSFNFVIDKVIDFLKLESEEK